LKTLHLYDEGFFVFVINPDLLTKYLLGKISSNRITKMLF